MSISKEQVIDALRNVEEPDLKKDLVTLNMIRDVEVNGKEVSFTVMLTTPACPLKGLIENACINAIIHYVDKEAVVKVNMTSDVTSRRSDNRELLPNVKNIIAIASGKGGVGKSTVAANLACALAMTGARVGLVDADIYGPSVPIMFGLQDEKLYAEEKNGMTYMIPAEKFGVKLMSIGFLTDASRPIPWRGPMASKALTQMFSDADWGELDYMLIDLPPGTGDIHLTLVSAVPVTGAIVVTTPQNVALADARKGINMFRLPQINVPVLGLVENMAWFTPKELPENNYFIFGKDGGKNLSAELNIPLLGQIPLVQSICDSGDAGKPAVTDESSPVAKAFQMLAGSVAQQIAMRNANLAPTERVQATGY